MGGSTVAKHEDCAGIGSQLSGVVIAGYGSTGALLKTENYDGTAFANGPSLNPTGRMEHGAFGAMDAAVCFGGIVPGPTRKKSSETSDGTAWSFAGNMATYRTYTGGVGVQVAGLAIGAQDGGYPAAQNTFEKFDGSVWSTGGGLSISRGRGAYAGTQISAVIFGGRYTVSGITYSVYSTDIYDGAAWSVVSGGDIPSGRYSFAGCGSQNNSIIFGGLLDSTGVVTKQTYSWDGTAFSVEGDIVNGTESHGGAGSANAGLLLGGRASSPYQCEEFDKEMSSASQPKIWICM
jgi:hypothetical protein